MDLDEMNKNGRKRYRKANSNEMTQTEAYEEDTQIFKPLPGFSRAQKRLRKAKAIAKAQAKAKAKAIANANNQEAKPNSKDNAKAWGSQVKLFFKSANLDTLLTPENMIQLQEAILDVTVNNKSNVLPQFEACTPQFEWLQLVCANKRTADWVRNNMTAIRRKSGLNIELFEENQLPRNIVKGCFPNSSNLRHSKVLALIAAQNPIQTREWKVLYTAISGQNLYLAMGVDDKSFKTLTSFGGRISYCFGRVTLILNGDVLSLDAASSDGSLQLPNAGDCNAWETIIENLAADDKSQSEYNLDGNKRGWEMSSDSSY